jgi:hypothetical protein
MGKKKNGQMTTSFYFLKLTPMPFIPRFKNLGFSGSFDKIMITNDLWADIMP